MNSFFSSTANCRIRWMDLPGQGVPLVFVHGLGCASSFEYPRVVVDPLFAGRRAILIDLPGCGYSEKPDAFGYTIAQQAQVVVELVSALQLEKFFLYGHSMGGSISIEAATQLTDSLSGLIVSEPNFHPGGGFFSRQVCRHSQERFVNEIYPRMIAAKSDDTASLAVDSPQAVWRGAESLIAGNDWFNIFKKLALPKQLIFGAHSLPDDDFSHLQAAGVATRILPDCGHSVSLENPGALAQALTEFCRQHEQQR